MPVDYNLLTNAQPTQLQNLYLHTINDNTGISFDTSFQKRLQLQM
jgi:hypothetical protein